MKHTKLIAMGLTAAMTLTGASTVFAEDTGTVNTEKSTQAQETIRSEEIDMSGLDLPEDFVPFDEAHVPDGIHAPKNGELRPIEFDEEGNMIFGQRPPMFGEKPGFAEGERPERPDFQNGERPERPNLQNGELPEWPDFQNGELPELPDFQNGELPERPDFQNGELPELPDFQNGELPELPEGELPDFQAGGMQSGAQNL